MVMRWTLFGILALLAVGCSDPQDPTARVERVLLLGIDQLSHERVDALVERGELPNFARLAREGARGVAIAPDPLLRAMLWSTVLTGKGVAQHEVTADLVQLGADTRCLAPSSMRAVRNLFQVAGLEGVPLAAVGFPGTWPAETVNGFLVSDGTAPSRWTETVEHNFERVGGFMDTFPPALYPEIEPMLRGVDELERELVSRFFVFQETEYRMLYDAPLGSIYRLENPPKDFAITLQRDRSHLDIFRYLVDRYSPRLAAVHLGLLGAIQPAYWPFSYPELYQTPADSRRRFGDSVDEAYRWLDEQIGLLMDSLPPRSVVCIVSEQGYSNGPDPRDPESGKLVSLPSNEASIFLWGQGVRRGFDLGRVSTADTTPTLLRLLDAAVGDDMEGQVLERALTDEWKDAHRERFISSHDENWDQSLRYPPRADSETTPSASEADEETP